MERIVAKKKKNYIFDSFNFWKSKNKGIFFFFIVKNSSQFEFHILFSTIRAANHDFSNNFIIFYRKIF